MHQPLLGSYQMLAYTVVPAGKRAAAVIKQCWDRSSVTHLLSESVGTSQEATVTCRMKVQRDIFPPVWVHRGSPQAMTTRTASLLRNGTHTRLITPQHTARYSTPNGTAVLAGCAAAVPPYHVYTARYSKGCCCCKSLESTLRYDTIQHVHQQRHQTTKNPIQWIHAVQLLTSSLQRPD